jgi:predicted Zn-dependent peptidase
MRLLPFIVSFLLGSLLFSSATAQVEHITQDNVITLKLGINGANAILMPLSGSDKTEMTLTVITGSAFESDTVNGAAYVLQRILSLKIRDYLVSRRGGINSDNTQFSSTSTSERTAFKLTLDEENINEGLELLMKSVMTPRITEEELARALDTIDVETRLAEQNPRVVFENMILKSVFRGKVKRIHAQDNPEEMKRMDLSVVERFFKKYYVPNNTIVLATGNFKYMQFEKYWSDLFSLLFRSEFDPEFITKLPDFRPMVYTTQFIVEDSLALPEFHICWQFPGTNTGQVSSYSALLLTKILNDKNNFIQVKAAKMGCRKLEARYEASNYSSIFRVILIPDSQQVVATYKFVMKELLRLEKTLVNESMINAGKYQFHRDYEIEKRTKTYAEKIIAHWVYKDNSYYRDVADSVFRIREKKFASFVIEYMNLTPHVTGLLISKADRERLKIDSSFTDVNEGIADSVFRYQQNITDLEGSANLANQHKLAQWLLINKDVNVQINGYSDEREYNRVKEKEILNFLDSVPSFRKVTNDIIERGYMRPEMMRAIKVMKYLYEQGIEPERMSGTAMNFKSEDEEEAIENMKCTVTIDNLYKGMPLREYHYGKQRQ